MLTIVLSASCYGASVIKIIVRNYRKKKFVTNYKSEQQNTVTVVELKLFIVGFMIFTVEFLMFIAMIFTAYYAVSGRDTTAPKQV